MKKRRRIEMKDLVKIILKKEDIKCSGKAGQKTRMSNTTKTQRALWNHQNNNDNNNNNNNNKISVCEQKPF